MNHHVTNPIRPQRTISQHHPLSQPLELLDLDLTQGPTGLGGTWWSDGHFEKGEVVDFPNLNDWIWCLFPDVQTNSDDETAKEKK